jgi:hypothetical protein
MCGDRILAIEIFFLDYRSCAYLSPSPHCIYNFRNISVLLCMRRSKEIYLVLLCIYILLDLIEYVMISSAFDWHWEFCFKNTIDESLLFPGPKLEVCMPCFQRSKDNAWGLLCFSWLKQWGKNCIQFST